MKTWKNFRVLVLLQANRAFQLFQPAICNRWSFRHRFSVPFCEQEKKFFFLNKKKNEEKSLLFSALYITSLLLSNSPGNSPKKHFLVTWQTECSRAFQLVTGVSRCCFGCEEEGRGRGFIIQDYGTCGNVWENGRERLLSERKTQRLLRRSPTKPLLRFTSPSLLMKGVL